MIEDAHWADEATLDLLMFLGRRLAQVRALLVVTFRDDEVGVDHPLPAALSTLPNDGVRRIPLSALTPAAVAELAARSGRDAADVHAVTGGNPLLVSEVLAAEHSGVPAPVRDLVLARVRSLPEAARDVARLVSVVPGRVEPHLVAAMSDAVTACVDGGVLTGVDGGVAFRHELLRRAVEDSLSPVHRAELHATVLEALATLDRVDGARVDPARLAHHARHAGDVDAVLLHAPAAARHAAAMNSHRAALDHLRSALPYADRLVLPERAELLTAFGMQAQRAGMAEEGLPVLLRALRLWEELGATERTGWCLRWLSRSAWWTGRITEAEAYSRQAIATLETLPPGRYLAMAYSNRSALHMLAGEGADASAW
ncbi:MAG: hypothetical protein ACRD0H_15380, partial [Actinomycetes bacterium]